MSRAVCGASGVGLVLVIAGCGVGTPGASVAPSGSVSSGSVSAGAVVTTTDVSHGAVSKTSSVPTPPVASSPSRVVGVSRLPTVPEATAIGVPVTTGAGTSKVVIQANPDGCDRAYGTADQCIPLRVGGGGPVTCAYLTAYGFFKHPLQVHADPLGLMKKKSVNMNMAGPVITISGCTD